MSNAPTYKTPAIKTWVTDQGVRVFYTRAESIPMLQINVIFHAGSIIDKQHYGLSQLTNSLFGLGTQSISEKKISKTLSNVGAVFKTDADRDTSTLYLKTLTQASYLKPSLQIFEAIITQSIFPEEAFNIVKGQFFYGIMEALQTPETIAKNAYFHSLYGKHPYSNPVAGTLESIAALETKHVEKFYNTYYVASNCIITMVGDLHEEKARNISNELTKNMPQGKHVRTAKFKDSSFTEILEQHIPFKSEQAHILIGKVGLLPKSPDTLTLMLGNEVLGGSGFNSRLFKEIRSKQGLAYTIGSTLMPLKNRGPMTILLQTAQTQVKKTLDSVYKVISDFIVAGPTEEELVSIKNKLTHAFPLRFAGNTAVLQELTNLAIYEYPLDYFKTYLSHIQHITTEQVREIYKKHHITVDSMVKIIVGGQLNS